MGHAWLMWLFAGACLTSQFSVFMVHVETRNQYPPVLAVCKVTHAQVTRFPMKSTCSSLKLLTLCLQEVNGQWCQK